MPWKTKNINGILNSLVCGNSEENIRKKFSIIYFCCSILVIYGHTYNLDVYQICKDTCGFGIVTYAIETYMSNLTKLADPIFFFVSGLLFYRTFEVNNLLKKWKSRLFSIVIPYLIWNTVYYLFFTLCTNLPVIGSRMNTECIQFSLNNWISWLWVDRYYVFGFLQNLIIFILLAPVIWLLINNHFKKIPTGLVLLIILCALVNNKEIDIPFTCGLDYYLAGSYIGLNCREKLEKKNKIASIIALAFTIFEIIDSFEFGCFCVEVTYIISLWYLIDLADVGKIQLPWWMQITFFTYVIHDLILEPIRKVILLIGEYDAVYALLSFVFSPILTLGISCLVAYFLMHKTQKLWKVLVGLR